MARIQINFKGAVGGVGAVALVVLAIAGCASLNASSVSHADVVAVMKSSFSSKGPATVDRVMNQDEAQKLCSTGSPVSKEAAAKIEATELASIKPPTDGQYIGDWKRGEQVAQNGRGMQFSDKAGDVNGGNCYACHQMTKAEISYGNIGPSLYRYGKLRGTSDAILKYTWGKVYDAQAYNACSNMPRFGHNQVLSEQQLKDVVALLLDPKSPVNQ